jgi:predicted outer membrane repeat protein
VVALFLLAIGSAVNAKTIYVDADAAGSGTGTNWANAYPYLQDALADANTSAKPVEIRVGQGTYKPDEGAGVSDGDREATFQLINGVTLKGGYAGDGEPDPNARDIDNYETILSGDLDGNDANVSNPADLLTEPTRSENSYNVLIGSNTDETVVLDGFVITAGNANGDSSPGWCGGGMYCDDGNPVVINCTFSDNSASLHGGGINVVFGDIGPTISNCTFTQNCADFGGGIFCDMTAVTNCTFTGNSAYSAGGGAYVGDSTTMTRCVFNNNSSMNDGGAIGLQGNPKLINCTFSDNSASRDGAGVSGLGISFKRCNPTLTNCISNDNLAGNNGGGMAFWGNCEPNLISCTFNGNEATNDGGGIFMLAYDENIQILTNCIFSGNSAGGDGGGYSTTHSTTKFTNCTFSENSASVDGGAFSISVNGGTPDFNNCILWGNTANNEGPQIAIKSSGATVDVNYCDVQGGYWDIYVSAGALNYGVNNINSDPLFVDAAELRC